MCVCISIPVWKFTSVSVWARKTLRSFITHSDGLLYDFYSVLVAMLLLSLNSFWVHFMLSTQKKKTYPFSTFTVRLLAVKIISEWCHTFCVHGRQKIDPIQNIMLEYEWMQLIIASSFSFRSVARAFQLLVQRKRWIDVKHFVWFQFFSSLFPHPTILKLLDKLFRFILFVSFLQ